MVFDDRDRLYCDHCGRACHTRATCWDLHGRSQEPTLRPSQQGSFTGGRGSTPSSLGGGRSTVYVATPFDVVPPTSSLALFESSVVSSGELASLREEMAFLRRLMAQMDTSSSSSSTGVTGIFNFALSALSGPFGTSSGPSGVSWIIDSGASHPMTGTSSLLSSYTISSCRDTVRIADGSLSAIVGIGFVPISSSLFLSFVFHVPNF